ncbi:endonuclease V [bacterium]|nr:endonuclease V [bacterium]
MNIPRLHSWKLDYESARLLQIELRSRLVLNSDLTKIETIAGCDVSQNMGTGLFFASAVIMDFNNFKVIEERTAAVEVDFPYIPGLLSFREMPALLKVWELVETIPDVIIVDGQGTIHPRRMGLACHLGLWLNLPTIGCAKKPLCGDFQMPSNERGSCELIRMNEEIIGAVLRTRSGVKPVFVSPGNLIDLDKSMEIVLQAGKYRLPEPIRAAHTAANRARIKMVDS